MREVERLAAYGLETDGYLPKASEVTIDLLWSKRLRNHCKYIADHLKGRDMYDMWLKTATGIDKKYFEHFLCFGEGVFGDCVDRDRVFGDDGIMSWPAGDDPATNEEEEEEVNDFKSGSNYVFTGFFLDRRQWLWNPLPDCDGPFCQLCSFRIEELRSGNAAVSLLYYETLPQTRIKVI